MTTIDDYLAELESLLAEVEPSTREGLVAGIREELAGLSSADAEARLRQLGDPAFVAASVRAESAPPVTPRKQDAAWYSVVTVLLITIGGFIVPVIGWIVGLVMLWASRTWSTAQKLVGMLVALLGPGFVAAGLLAWTASPTAGAGAEQAASVGPIVLLVVFLVVWIGGAVWLLVAADRARQRG